MLFSKAQTIMLTPMRDLVPDKKKGIPTSTIITGILLGLIVAILVRSIIHGFFFFPYTIKNNLMFPGLKPGQSVTISHDLKKDNLKRGTILLIQHPAYKDEDRLFMARLIALPGETFQLESRQVLINHKLLQAAWEKAIHAKLKYRDQQALLAGNQKRDFYPAVKIQADHIFVLADNRQDGSDSRQLGPIHLAQVKGVVESD